MPLSPFFRNNQSQSPSGDSGTDDEEENYDREHEHHDVDADAGVDDTGSDTPGSGRVLRVEDALHFLERVKALFNNDPRKYNSFLEIMRDFRSRVSDTSEVIRRVSDLFHGHDEIILHFNAFLPPGYEIEIRKDEATGDYVKGFVSPGRPFSRLD